MTDVELQWLQRNTMALEAIALTLQTIRQQLMADHVPNYQYDLAAFKGFNWESIGAVVMERDPHGVATVSWAGHTYTRRAPQNKFGDAIWFSRCTGKAADGAPQYARLITFKRRNTKAEPVSARVSQYIPTASFFPN